MLQRILFFLIIVGVSAAGSSAVFAADEVIQAQIKPDTASLGDEVVYSVEVTIAGEKQSSPDIMMADLSSQFQLGEVFTTSDVVMLNGKTYMRNVKEAHLIANHKGLIQIAPCKVELIIPETQVRVTRQTNAVMLTVNEAKGAVALPTPTPVIEVLRGIKSSAHVSVSQWLPFVAGIVILGSFFYGIYWYRHRPAPGPEKPAEPVDTRTPEQRAMDELAKASALKAEGKINEFYTALSAILRRFMSESYGFKAEESTTREMLAMMESKKFKPEFLKKYRQYFLECDQVKFANAIPAPERLEAAFPRAVEFIKTPGQIVVETPPPVLPNVAPAESGAPVAVAAAPAESTAPSAPVSAPAPAPKPAGQPPKDPRTP
jgi:hypothetical protein